METWLQKLIESYGHKMIVYDDCSDLDVENWASIIEIYKYRHPDNRMTPISDGCSILRAKIYSTISLQDALEKLESISSDISALNESDKTWFKVTSNGEGVLITKPEPIYVYKY